MSKHSTLTGASIHVLHAFTYADAAARAAASLTETDVGKVARQTDTGAFYVLKNHSPLTWQELGGGAQTPLAQNVDTAGFSFITADGENVSNGMTLNTGNVISGSGQAGSINLIVGTSLEGDGGSIALTAGSGNGTDQDGGDISLIPGGGTGTGANGRTWIGRGSLSGELITNGQSILSNANGSSSAVNLILRSGDTSGAASSGDINIETGSTVEGDTQPGDINLLTGTCTLISSGSNHSGAINFRTGNTGDSGRGVINLNDMWKVTEYYPTNDTTRLMSTFTNAEITGKCQDSGDTAGGVLEVKGGNATGNENGGELVLRGGYGSGSGFGGGIRMNAGDEAYIVLENLPTSDPVIAGAVWNDAGVLKISAGA